MCVARKRSLQIYSVNETHFSPLSEIQINDTPVRMVFSYPFVCFASLLQYHVVDFKENELGVADLFPYSDLPAIVSITDSEQNEFLLSGPGGKTTLQYRALLS